MSIRADVRLRAATAEDVPAVTAIYNAGIRSRRATFETTERTTDDVSPWLETPHPFMVAITDDADAAVVGWVRASSYRPRACYAGIGDFSVYVAEASRGQRVGHALLTAFLPACSDAGYWKLVSRLFPENAASRALCARHGFREVGTYERHAQLDGAWRDVLIIERLLPTVFNPS
jgi:L-amino acid N-acyltransferase YncA